MKPYHVIQPEGASFTVKGYFVEWEKWRFRVCFNWREGELDDYTLHRMDLTLAGMTLHDVSFDGTSVFYRLSLSECLFPMVTPGTQSTARAHSTWEMWVLV